MGLETAFECSRRSIRSAKRKVAPCFRQLGGQVHGVSVYPIGQRVEKRTARSAHAYRQLDLHVFEETEAAISEAKKVMRLLIAGVECQRFVEKRARP
jgi:hypothetical protein